MSNTLIDKNDHTTLNQSLKNIQIPKRVSNRKENSLKGTIVTVKVFQSKFINYLNQLNSSIQNCKRKTQKKTNPFEQRRKSAQNNQSFQADSQNDHDSRCSKKSNRTTERRRCLSKQYVVISGDKINGKIHGKAILELSNGSIFKGQVEQGEIKEGCMTFHDGSEYEGGFRNWLFHGPGRLKISNGTQYKSTFNNGVMNKKGKIIYDNGDTYEGQICQYKKHGYGQLKLKNGNRYVGDFIEGQITGFGVYYVNEFPIAKGMWNRGQFLGKNNTLSDEVMQSIQKN